MKLRACLRLVAVTAILAACSDDEELHSSPPCPQGLHQECKGDDDSVRCDCVGNTADSGSGGSDADDAGEPDAP